MFLVAVALVVYASSLNLVRLMKSTKYQNLAYHLATRNMETLRATGFDSLPVSGPLTDSELLLLPSGSGSMTFTDINTDLKQVNITVSWNESGNTKSVSYDTYIYSGGLNNL